MNEDLLVDITKVYKLKGLLEQTSSHYQTGTKNVKDGKLIIPAYQRHYSWEASNFTDFIETLSEFAERKCKDTKFFGQLILHYNEEGDYEIVDGQQRFTTFTILAHIIDSDLNSDECEDIKSFLYINNDKNALRLQHQPVNNRVFEEYILLKKSKYTVNKDVINCLENYNDGIISDSECRKKLLSIYSSSRGMNSYKKAHYYPIVTGYNLLSEFYYNMDEVARPFIIQEIKNKIYFSILRSNSFDMAYESFMSLNAKGRPLSAFDLVKSVLIGASGLKKNNEVEKNWDNKIEYNNLNTSKLVDILEIMLKVEYLEECKSISNNNAIDFKHNNLHHLIKKLTEYTDVESIFVTYSKYIEQYVSIENGNLSSVIGSHFEEYNSSAKRLLKMDYKPFLPILFKFINEGNKEKKVLENIINIAKYAPFLYVTVANGRPSVLNNIVIDYLDDMDLKDNNIELVYSKFREKMPIINFVNAMKNNVQLKKNDVSKDLLLLLEPTLGENGKYEDQLEHIFPQKYKITEWEEFRDHKEYVYNIGNHVIIPATLNKKLKNQSYKKKKEIIKMYKEDLTRYKNIDEAFTHTNYTPKIVNKRAVSYAEGLEKIFIEMGLLEEKNV